MLQKDYGIITLICASLSVGAVWAMANEPQENSQLEAYQADIQRIESLRGVKNLMALEGLAEELHAVWSRPERDVKLYGDLMLKLADRFNSGPFSDKRQYELARKYSLLALTRADELRIETEVGLAQHQVATLYGRHAVRAEEWSQLRSEQMQHWFHAHRRLHGAIDPNWDPESKPLSATPPPPHGVTSWVGGASPASIKDPKLRAEYEQVVAEHWRKVREHREQKGLRRLAERFDAQLEKYVIQAFSHLPFNIEELAALLQESIADEATRNRILEAVRSNMSKVRPAADQGEQREP